MDRVEPTIPKAMGRLSRSTPLPPYTDEASRGGAAAETASLHSAVSLHAFEESNDDEELPAYDAELETSIQEGQNVLAPTGHELVRPPWHAAMQAAANRSSTAAPIFSNDPKALYDLLEHQSSLPPYPILHLD